MEHSAEGWGAPAHRGTKRCQVAPKSLENSRRTGWVEELSDVQPTLIWRYINTHNTVSHDLCVGWVITAAKRREAIKAALLYLKLDDSVLIHFNISGGNGMLSKLTGDEHHG